MRNTDTEDAVRYKLIGRDHRNAMSIRMGIDSRMLVIAATAGSRSMMKVGVMVSSLLEGFAYGLLKLKINHSTIDTNPALKPRKNAGFEGVI